MNTASAQKMAIDILGWLAQDDERLGQFLNMAGADVSDLRTRAQDPEFMGFLVDFLLSDETQLFAFCDDTQRPYDAPMIARQYLPGGDVPNWT